jgi:small subunit ribosomal protein S8
MSFCNDPISDMLTRIRNGLTVRRKSVEIPFSRVKKSILDVLWREGFIQEVSEHVDEKTTFKSLRVRLAYASGRPVVQELKRVSKPSCRRYSKISELRPLYSGLGIWILSTPAGILSDREARVKRVGGEVLCKVF